MHEPKFVAAINRVHQQLKRGDYSAALLTFKHTEYLPECAVRRFVKHAPALLVENLLHAYKKYCLLGLNGENVFARSINLAVLLSLFRTKGIVRYYKEKESILSVIHGLGSVVPLIITQEINSTEERILKFTSHTKLLNEGFVRVEWDKYSSKYMHPDLPFVVTTCTHRSELNKLFHEAMLSSPHKSSFMRPSTHEGWLAQGFAVKQKTCRSILYSRMNEAGKEESYTVMLSDAQIAEQYHKEKLTTEQAGGHVNE